MNLTDIQISGLCRGLGLMLHGGISLADGAYLMAEEERGDLKAALTDLGAKLDSGVALSRAMEETALFSPYVTGMVAIGERTGRLEETLEGLASFYDERQRMASRLRGALVYPSMILLLMLAVVGVLLVRVLPVFEEVYQSLGSALTGLAGGLLGLGQLLDGALPGLLALLMLLVAAALLYGCLEPFRQWCHGVWRCQFGDRGVSRKFNNARFARAMAMGLASGLPLEEALELSRLLLAHIQGAEERCRVCAQALVRGDSLAEAMGAADLLSGPDCRMLMVGLKGGNADRVMTQIADRLMAEAEQTLDENISRVEPAMVLSASILVGVILLSVMLPLMNIMSVLG